MSLRVGLITSEFPPDHGGVETYAWQLATELGSRPELDITVYAPHKAATVEPPAGVKIKPIISSCMGLDWAKLQHEPIDVWHALSAAHGWIAEKGRPSVVSVHGNDFLAPYPLTQRPAFDSIGLYRFRPFLWSNLRPFWRRRTFLMLKRALPRSGVILANSRYTANVLVNKFPSCADKIDVTWVGVDPVFFGIKPAARRQKTQLLTVARLSEPRKNVDRVLQALALLKDEYDFEYRVAGDGVLRPSLENLADALGLDDRVRFLGRISDAALRELYSEADLFVLTASISPESHEGLGIVYLEAAASGVPSLAARLAGAAEAVSEGRSGFFVEQPEVGSIRDALEAYLREDIAFSAAQCRDVARSFDWRRIAEACESHYVRLSRL